jgi:hypothetical protein
MTRHTRTKSEPEGETVKPEISAEKRAQLDAAREKAFMARRRKQKDRLLKEMHDVVQKLAESGSASDEENIEIQCSEAASKLQMCAESAKRRKVLKAEEARAVGAAAEEAHAAAAKAEAERVAVAPTGTAMTDECLRQG